MILRQTVSVIELEYRHTTEGIGSTEVSSLLGRTLQNTINLRQYFCLPVNGSFETFHNIHNQGIVSCTSVQFKDLCQLPGLRYF